MKTRCCIAGGGPAGVMLGYLLARAGIDVIVLEKHRDFFRDFRGDTIHPSTLTVMQELGLLEDLLKLRHSEIPKISGIVSGEVVQFVDFAHVPGPCKFVAFMPQWDFLNFLAERAKQFPAFHLLMETEARTFRFDGSRISGVNAVLQGKDLEIEADLVVAADGRSSTLRAESGLPLLEVGVPIDVLWMRLSKKPSDPPQTFGNVVSGGILVAIDRIDYYQCAFVIQKGGLDAIQAAGLPAFRQKVAKVAPYLADRVGELQSWDDIKLLTVQVNRLQKWYRSGLLCIGDAAHAMSPVGGIGINLAIQDAVAAANLLVPVFRQGTPDDADLEKVQARRGPPTRRTQALQMLIQERILSRVLDPNAKIKLPWFFRMFNWIPLLRRIPARIVGIGFLPEHVDKDVLQSAVAPGPPG